MLARSTWLAHFLQDFTNRFVPAWVADRILTGDHIASEEEAMDTARAVKVLLRLILFMGMIQAALPSATEAETYLAGQFGVTFPGKGLSDGDLTSTSAPFLGGTVHYPSGTTVSDQSLKNSLLIGGKIGHYFSRAKWLGLEAELFYSTPHIKQQDITFRSGTPFTFTPSGGGPNTPLGNQLTAVGIEGANFHVLTIAPLNILFRYPGHRLQPYIGVGPGIFIARIKDPSITQGDASQSSTKLGLNTFIGARYFLTRHVSAFAEGKYNYVRFNFGENPNFFGFKATYAPISVAFGVAYHF
jgi:opacity protein-like surface antigen